MHSLRLWRYSLRRRGGKIRTAPVLNEYKDKLTEVVDKHSRGAGKPLFDTYDSHIDNHAFRSEYATALLAQLESERKADVELCGGDFDPYTLVNYKTLKQTPHFADMTEIFAVW